MKACTVDCGVAPEDLYHFEEVNIAKGHHLPRFALELYQACDAKNSLIMSDCTGFLPSTPILGY